MRGGQIVVDRPFFDAVSGVPIAGEEPLIETLVAQPSVEALHEAILHRFARRDVVPFDLPILLVRKDGIRGQLGAVVRHDHARVAALCGDNGAFLGDVSVSEAKSRLQRWLAFCGIAIGALAPSARLRPPRLRTVSRSSR